MSASEKLADMPLMQHLRDLRRVIVAVFAVLLGGTLLVWPFSARILDGITRLLPESETTHIFSPPEAFLIRLKVSAVCGLVLGIPFVLYQIWKFIAPGLFRHERSRLLPVFLSSVLLFYAGTVFAYLVIIPVMISYFFGLRPAGTEMTVGISALFAVVAKLSVAFGVVFQLPLVILVLSALGLVSPRWLLRQWRWALIAMLVFSAILTPPDLISQVVMALPLFLLYVASGVIALVFERRRPPGGRR